MQLEALANLHRDALIADAQQHFFAQSIAEPQPPLYTKVLENVGAVLTGVGERLIQQACDAQMAWELKNRCEPRPVR